MTKEKSFSIKALLLSLLLIPAMFLLSACGSQLDANATVNITGTYSATTEDNDLGTFLADETTVTDFANGLHMTIEMDGMEIEEMGVKIYINAYVKYETNEETNTTTLTELAAKMSVTSSTGTETGNIYVKDGYLYADSEDGKIKSVAPSDLSDMFYDMDLTSADVQEMFSLFTENTGSFDVEIATAGTVTKYNLSLKDDYSGEELSSLADAELYFVFNNNQLTGVYMSMYNELMKISIVGFDGSISYPDFSDYQETVA